jgi:hypothetical protein
MVGDTGMLHLITLCPLLEDVDISYCNSITDRTLFAFGSITSTSLTAINLAGLGHLTDLGLTALANGCPSLKKLNLTACNKLTNLGMSSLSHLTRLESLNLSCCDLISDEGILSFSSSLHSLHSLDLSNCDQISLLSLTSLISNNTSLHKFHAMGCNLLSLDFHKLTKHLPFAKAMTSKCRLEPRHPSLIRYNSHILHFNQISFNLIHIQALIRSWLCYKIYQRYLLRKDTSVRTIQRVWRGYYSRVKTYLILKQQKIYTQQVIHLQRSLRRLHAISLSKAKKKYLLRRSRATQLLQRTTRGFLARMRLYHRFKSRPRTRTKFFYLAQKLMILRSARRLHFQIVQIQKLIRGKILRTRHRKILRGMRKFQRMFRVYRSLKVVLEALSEELIEEWSIKELAVERIIGCWRNKKHNAMICDFVYHCCVVYRNERDLQEWLYGQNTENAIKIQTFYRGYQVRKRQLIENLKRRKIEGNRAIVILQKTIRRYLTQKKFLVWRKKMKLISLHWKTLYNGVLAFFYRKQMKVLERTLKKNVFLRKRKRAADVISRVYRGHQARKLVREMIHEIHCGLVMRIQRAWRRYQERQRRWERYVTRHIAAKRIQVKPFSCPAHPLYLSLYLRYYSQRAVKRRLEHKAKQRVIAAKKAKALELELQRKEKLIKEKRLKALSPPPPLSL